MARTTGKVRRVQRVGRPVSKRVKRARPPARRRIDFSKIKWGTFTKRFLAWKRRHPRVKVNSLREFAAYVLSHPDRFSLHARRKALFYRNIILKGKIKMPIKSYHGVKRRTTRSTKARTARRAKPKQARRRSRRVHA